MRAQIILPKGTEGHRSRAQGTDRAQIENLICALGSLCFYSFIYLKGTKAQINNNPQDIYKKGKYRPKQGQTASAFRMLAVWVLSVPCALSLATGDLA